MLLWLAGFSAQSTQQGSTLIPEASNRPERMQEWVNEGTATQRVDRLVALGVDRAAARTVVHPQPTDLEWQPLAGQRTPTAALFIPCAGDDANLFLLQRTNGNWHVSDKTTFDCHYDESVSIELRAVRNPGVDELLVHHACDGHGAGYVEQHLRVFAISHGKLKQELDTEEVVKSYPPGEPWSIQTSVFTVVPISHNRTRTIEETRSTTTQGTLSVSRRTFRWDSASSRYIPSNFYRVVAEK